jgi:hypothetical protein
MITVAFVNPADAAEFHDVCTNTEDHVATTPRALRASVASSR